MLPLAYYLHDLSPFIWQFREGIGLRWYGFAYVMAFFCGWWLYRLLAQRGYSQLKPDAVGDFITWAAVFGVMLGGRLGYVLIYDWHGFWTNPLSFFVVWKGGMASHGGMLGLVAFTYYYARRHSLSWTSIGDSLCVVAPVGLFFGRVANFINGELWGRESTVPWAVQFPSELLENDHLARQVASTLATRIPPVGDGLDLRFDNADIIVEQAKTDPAVQEILREMLPPRHPSQLYEALLEGVFLFVVLWLLRTRTRQPRGALTGLFFILYAIVRIIGECFRVPDSAWHVGPLSAGQFLSLFLILIGAAFLAYAYRTRRYEAHDVPAQK